MFFIFLQNILFFEFIYLFLNFKQFTNNLISVETMSRNYGIYLHTLKTFTWDMQGKCKNIIYTMGKLLHLPHTTLINLKADIEIGLM
jgi:hypothetical protein